MIKIGKKSSKQINKKRKVHLAIENYNLSFKYFMNIILIFILHVINLFFIKLFITNV